MQSSMVLHNCVQTADRGAQTMAGAISQRLWTGSEFICGDHDGSNVVFWIMML